VATEPQAEGAQGRPGVGPALKQAGGLPDVWLRRGWRAWLLWPFSLLYRALLAVRSLLYRVGVWRSTALPVPVVVVGNVAVGGGGKTPTVLALVRRLQAQGWSPGIVSRGYGGQALKDTPNACLRVEPGPGGAQRFGDEPALLALHSGVPVVVGRQRAEAARTLLQQAPQTDIVVSDDGMQHWALTRDLTLVLFDERGLGNGWLLPAGLLREPWPPAPGRRPWQRPAPPGLPPFMVLGRLNGPTLPPDGFARYSVTRRLAAQCTSASGLGQSLQGLAAQCAARGAPVGALAGIAQPQRFFQMLQDSGLILAETLPLPDHADTPSVLSALEGALQVQPDSIWLCTEKDAVKCFDQLAPAWQHRVWAVPLEQDLEPAFWRAFDAYLQAWRNHQVQTDAQSPT
jgi:tetraacyldisaccharide 4'-kinase